MATKGVCVNFNIQFERAVLSAIFFDPKVFEGIEGELSPSDFGHKNHSAIFKAMSDLHSADLPITEDLVTQKIQSAKSDICDIAATTPIVDVRAYVREIKDLSLKRKLHHLALAIKEKSVDASLPSEEILSFLEGEVFKLHGGASSGGFREFREILHDVMTEGLERKEQGNRVVINLHTNFFELDRITTGFNKGDLIVIGARPGVGKTALALNMIIPTLRSLKGVAFFSLEMPDKQLAQRLLSIVALTPLQQIRRFDFRDNELSHLQRKMDEMSAWRLHIDDTSGLNIARLRSRLRTQMIKDPAIALVVVDYLQLMSGVSGKDRHLEVAEISRGLKILARELEVPIIALSQLNRLTEQRSDKQPQLSDLRESGSIEQDADIVILISNESDKKKDAKDAKPQKPPQDRINAEVELIVAKNRNGPTGRIKLQMQTEYTRFSEIESGAIEQSDTKLDLDSL